MKTSHQIFPIAILVALFMLMPNAANAGPDVVEPMARKTVQKQCGCNQTFFETVTPGYPTKFPEGGTFTSYTFVYSCTGKSGFATVACSESYTKHGDQRLKCEYAVCQDR